MKITAQMVKELRERTSAGMMDCKKMLQEAEGDMEKAAELLRKKGLAAADKKSGRTAAEGAVGSYIHGTGSIGVLVEVNCETDFVARTDEFQTLVRDIAMHIAAADPRFVRREEVTQSVLDKEAEIYADQMRAEGKPEKIIPNIVKGKIEKYYSEHCLLEQAYIKDTDKSVQGMITEKIAKIGENIQVRRFARFKLGEGIEKKSDDFAAEVAAMAGGK